MSSTFSTYQKSTGWNCLSSCGRCCLNPEVEASLYEMIPMALAIYEEGKLDEWVEKLTTSSQDYCLAYVDGKKSGEGTCGRYEERPSICRMFAVAGLRNKNGQVTLSICRYIKEEYHIQKIPVGLSEEETPLMVKWSYKLASLDQRLVQERMPINQALYQALGKVALYAGYQEEELKRNDANISK